MQLNENINICPFFLQINQLFFLLGVKFSNAIYASAWQPSQAIWSLLIGSILGIDVISIRKLFGIIICVGSCLFLVLFDRNINLNDDIYIGNLMFLLNCLGLSSAIITSKQIQFKEQSTITLVTYFYISATIFQFTTLLIVNQNSNLLKFVCQSCYNGQIFPIQEIPYLIQWIFIGSILELQMKFYASKYLLPSVLQSQWSIQPLSCVFLDIILLSFGKGKGILEYPGYNIFGSIGIILGLSFIVQDNYQHENIQKDNLITNLI